MCSVRILNILEVIAEKSFSKNRKVLNPDPSRWEGKESNTLQDEAWFGFGQGPRACPGTRLAYYFMKIYIIQLLKQFKIVKTEGTPENAKAQIINFKLGSDKPLLVKLEKR